MDGQRGLTVRRKLSGARLRSLRVRYDLSLEECAQALVVSPEMLAARELGREPLTVADFCRFCGYAGLEPAEALAGERRPGEAPSERRLRAHRKYLGAALAEERDARGLSHAEAAAAVGMGEERLRLGELGRAALDMAELEALAAAYSMTADALFPTPAPTQPARETAPALDLAADVSEFLQRPDAERYVRAAMALSRLDGGAIASLEDALLFLSGSA